MDKAVAKTMVMAMTKMIMVQKIPPLPTTYPARMNMMSPKMVRREGVKTPPKVPNWCPPPLDASCLIIATASFAVLSMPIKLALPSVDVNLTLEK